ncbi:MAG: hypothetical protein FWD24_05020 [Treponema sp.]|nr:hypothetical protein [Treponema sp.]
MKRIFLSLSIMMALIMLSCGSSPEKTENSPPNTSTSNERPANQVSAFDPRTISQAQYDSTRIEVQLFIENLNQIIRNRNFQAWRACLSRDYFDEISSAENLRQISEQPAMRTRNIVLRNAEDYFIHVVVPSRANSRVDDIEFITVNRVNAFTISINSRGEEQRLRLYALEKIGNNWTIIN